MSSLPSTTPPELFDRITTLLTSFHVALAHSTSLTLAIASPRSSPPVLHTLTFPGSTPREAWRFTIYLSLLSAIHHLLSTNQTATKRDIFYQHISLFRTQAVVDKAVEELAATFSVPRSALGVVAAAKGMVKGGMRIVMSRDESVECSTAATLIPPGIQVERIELLDEVEWILFIEKEAIFQRLGVGKKGVAITGKGYPDVATRELLVRLAAMGKRVFALVDLDPHGIEIMATVRFGSRAMAHEGVRLCVEGLHWIGVRYEDLVDIKNGREGLLGLTLRDRQKAVGMLARAWMEEVPEWKEALQRMLFCGMKAEIEILGEDLWEWTEGKIGDL